MTIRNIKETSKGLTIEFHSDDETHVGDVVATKYNGVPIYFKVSEVSTINITTAKVIAEEYGHKKTKINILDLVSNYFVELVTDENILTKLKQQSCWL